MVSSPRVALLCSGLGRVSRGHEVFAQDLFTLLDGHLDITLFKGGGEPGPREQVVANIPRRSDLLDHIHPTTTGRWASSIIESERQRIEHETFAYACLQPLLSGDFDVIHCLEREVCEIVHRNRHLFRRIPKILFSNGGAIPGYELPPCDAVQEHSAYNLRYSDRRKAVLIPHGVDLQRFRPGIVSGFRQAHGIAKQAWVVVSVGTLDTQHKRMDHVIREVAPLHEVHLVLIGQEGDETPAIRELGRRLLGPRLTITRLAHADLPQALAACDVFVLGSLFETFGIAYIEAMAMGLPVVCTHHPNQRLIVKEGVFIDMAQAGALTRALESRTRAQWQELGQAGLQVVRQHHDLETLRMRYLQTYERLAADQAVLPREPWARRAHHHVEHFARQVQRLMRGYARR